MKNRLLYIQLFGILLLILLLLLVVPKYAKIIPKTLSKRVNQTLIENNISWVSVRAEGRDITLSGIAPNLETHQKALQLTKEINGIRNVEDKISPMLISPYTMNLYYDKQNITLTGYMPSKQSKKTLLNVLKTNHKNVNIIDKIDIANGEPQGWKPFIRTIIRELNHLKIASVNIVNKELHISGKIATEKEKALLVKALEKHKNKQFIIHESIVAMDASAKFCQKRFNALLVAEKIKFESAKSILKPENNQLLQNLSDTALLCPNVNIQVIGHTDSLGNDEENLKLSLARAKVVVAKLFELGIGLERIEAKGEGEKSPIADNTSDDGRAKNRRIEFKVTEN